LGFIFYIPPFNASVSENQLLFNELFGLPKLLRAAPAELPSWASLYQSARERSTTTKIADLERSAAELQARIVEEMEVLAEHAALKHLFCSTGAPFASAVASALSELSLSVVEGPHPRADLLATRANRFIAIEAKGGKSKGGARKLTQPLICRLRT
jgi:hypothetical protein